VSDTFTADIGSCVQFPGGGPNPFQSLKVHFGMLLGVGDFEALQAHPMGKMRLHNAWLHRDGVVWGYGVSVDPARGEIRVKPGLALDPAGHELHLDGDACLDVAAWLKKKLDDNDPDLLAVLARAGNIVSFDARVVIRYRTCCSREVPALAEPCEGGGGATVHSRVEETVEVLLLPGLAPERSVDDPYPRLRLLFALRDPASAGGVVIARDQAVLDRRTAILALPAADQPRAYLAAFRDLAALDEIDLAPLTPFDPASGPMPLYPGPEHAPVVLANLTAIRLEDAGGGTCTLTGVETLDVTVRPSHVATSTIQELLCGPLFTAIAGGAPGAPPPAPGEAEAGPRVVRSSVALNVRRRQITFDVNRALDPATVHRDAFTVSVLRAGAQGWSEAVVQDSSYEEAGGTFTVTVQLDRLPTGDDIRFVARGTGPTPLLGTDLAPLAGAVGEPAPPGGRDFVAMLRRA
jgi:hypothetical protein